MLQTESCCTLTCMATHLPGNKRLCMYIERPFVLRSQFTTAFFCSCLERLILVSYMRLRSLVLCNAVYSFVCGEELHGLTGLVDLSLTKNRNRDQLLSQSRRVCRSCCQLVTNPTLSDFNPYLGRVSVTRLLGASVFLKVGYKKKLIAAASKWTCCQANLFVVHPCATSCHQAYSGDGGGLFLSKQKSCGITD